MSDSSPAMTAAANEARERLRVRAGVRGVCAAHAEQVEHALLRAENGAAADCTDFDTGHGHGHEQVLAVVRLGKTLVKSTNTR